MFLHCDTNVEYNIKQNIYTGMEVISLLCLHDTQYKNSKNENVLMNNIDNPYMQDIRSFKNIGMKVLKYTSNMKVCYIIPLTIG